MSLPRHIAIVMDGNGRWAKQRKLPRIAGHQAGAKAVTEIIRACAEKKIPALTLWAFSTENWARPKDEVGFLMELMVKTLKKEIKKLHKNNIRFRSIGERSTLPLRLQQWITRSENLTAQNTGMNLTIAINYSGRWDLVQAMRKLAAEVQNGSLNPGDIDEKSISSEICLAELLDPDLLIRTSGEYRISNFFLWQLAYTELYFADVFWPDFNPSELEKALVNYAQRERRFGKISEQL